MTATTIALKLNSGAAAGSHYFEVIEAFVQFTVGSRDYNCRGNSMLLGSMGQRIGGGCSSTLGSGKAPRLGHRGGDTDDGCTETLRSGLLLSRTFAVDVGSRKRQ